MHAWLARHEVDGLRALDLMRRLLYAPVQRVLTAGLAGAAPEMRE
jgi:hypothetical protein